MLSYIKPLAKTFNSGLTLSRHFNDTCNRTRLSFEGCNIVSVKYRYIDDSERNAILNLKYK